MNQERLEALLAVLRSTESDVPDVVAAEAWRTCHAEMIQVADRLAILEAAVAWHGFDEVPEEGKEIDLVTDDGDIDREAGGDGLHDTEFYQFHGYTGWRYPVPDMSEEKCDETN